MKPSYSSTIFELTIFFILNRTELPHATAPLRASAKTFLCIEQAFFLLTLGDKKKKLWI
jgi:hypothetical protein